MNKSYLEKYIMDDIDSGIRKHSYHITAVPFRNLPVRIGSAYSNRLTLSREQSC